MAQTIVFQTQSGTCASSYDNTKCDLDLDVLVRYAEDSWQQNSVKWQSGPSVGTVIAETIVNVPYQKEASVSLDVTSYVQGLAEGQEQDFGLVLMAANDTDQTRREQASLHDDKYQIGRAIQRDVVVGNPVLKITYH